MADREAEDKRGLKDRREEAINKAKVRGEELLSQAEARRPGSAIIDVAFRSYEQDAPGGGRDPRRRGRLPGLPVRRPVRLLHRRGGRLRGRGARAGSTPELLEDANISRAPGGTITDVGNQSLGPDSPFSASAASLSLRHAGLHQGAEWSSTNWCGSCPGRGPGTRSGSSAAHSWPSWPASCSCRCSASSRTTPSRPGWWGRRSTWPYRPACGSSFRGGSSRIRTARSGRTSCRVRSWSASASRRCTCSPSSGSPDRSRASRRRSGRSAGRCRSSCGPM